MGTTTTQKVTYYDTASNHMTSTWAGSSQLRGFVHDGAGNITQDNRPGQALVISYNNRNRPVSVTQNALAYATYGYNALEQLTTRSTTASGGPVGQVAYIYDLDGHIIAEATASTGATTRDYIWQAANDNGPVDLPLAVADISGTTSTLSFVHADHLGRPIRITDATKATVWQAFYKPFGEAVTLSGTKANNLRFPGQYFQIETGFNYNWNRHYDPTTGRYTQPDPLRFIDGPSIYAYAGSSPFMRVDRRGLTPGDYPIPPPNYDPNTWGHGAFDNGRQFVTDPNSGRKFILNREDGGHYAHWGLQGKDGNDEGDWPPNCRKTRRGQLRPPYNNQSPTDPNDGQDRWTPPNSTPFISIDPLIEGAVELPFLRGVGVRVPIYVP